MTAGAYSGFAHPGVIVLFLHSVLEFTSAILKNKALQDGLWVWFVDECDEFPCFIPVGGLVVVGEEDVGCECAAE